MAKDDFNLQWDFSKYFAGLDGFDQATRDLATKAMRKVAIDGLGRMIEAAPVMTGYLRGSGSCFVNGQLAKRAPQPKDALHAAIGGRLGGEAKEEQATVIVWGFNAHYAAKVHEDMRAGRRGGGPKYVERIIVENYYKWMKFIADFIRKGLGKGGNQG